ncbi:MAG: response regulator, partial [Sedimenticolaceae bacterium]
MAKILIVDDSATELHVLAKILQQAGHQPLTAADGEAGIAAAKSQT